jgi:type II secretion system protein G
MNAKRQLGIRGFTLVEILAVMAIIAILAGIALGVAKLAATRGERARAVSDIHQIKELLEQFKLDKNRYPLNAAGSVTDILINVTDADMHSLTNDKPEVNLIDPWGRPYQYWLTTPFAYALYSLGPDPSPTNSTDDVDPSRGLE